MNSANISKQRRQLHKVLQQLKKHDKDVVVSEEPTNILFVSNSSVLCGVTIEELEEVFSPYDPKCSYIVFPTKKSYSFVIFSSTLCAEKAYSEINGTVPSILSKSDRPFIMAFISDLPTQLCDEYVIPNGFKIIENFISQHEEEELRGIVSSSRVAERLNNRCVLHYGYIFNYNTNCSDEKCSEFPSLCNTLVDRMITEKIILPEQRPDQITVNFYEPGQGIPAHVDTHSAFEDTILSLSLISNVVMEFRDCANSALKLDVLLPRYSLMVLKDDARYRYRHGISCRMYDVDPVSHRMFKREQRISFTFRKRRNQPCKCKFMEFCDWDRNGKMAIPNDDKNGRLLEKEYVKNVYENIADHFDETRYSQWKAIDQFLTGLPDGSLLFDSGCGNGKYLIRKDSLLKIGCDICEQLTKIAYNKGCSVIRADALAIAIKDSCMDAVLSIAVIHHFATKERRQQALQEIVRILKPGGMACITVWAMEQHLDGDSQYAKMRTNKEDEDLENLHDEKRILVHSGKEFKQQDVLVPWQKDPKGLKQFLRYYHVFVEKELDELIQEIPRTHIVSSVYEQGNWICIFKKV